MIRLEPDPTPWDLTWRLFGVPVRVHPWFWLVTALMGYPALERGFQYLLVWVGCVFVSILVHEFGHIFMGLYFGSPGHVVLYSFGGLAVGSNALPERRQRILVSLAGPLAGFLLLAVLAAGLALLAPDQFAAQWALLKALFGLPYEYMARPTWPPLAREVVGDLIQINLLWGILNLMPIWPLDGGQISREVAEGQRPGRGLRISLQISMVAAAVLAAQSLAAHFDKSPLPIPSGLFSTLFFGLLAFGSYQTLQQLPRGEIYEDDRSSWEQPRAPWERDPDYWKK